ncbi:hypothetical protein HPP92_013181 [Vanilla planifolia]|uniref:Peptidase C1A papain C-terminal domain-containing protein n=1 Tax=Vanilla planifolia TaxID=51239 RepID=A0A835QU40_VANPL|nr:hypothetical protein HPP92_013181 [Vanilla planifolia]
MTNQEFRAAYDGYRIGHHRSIRGTRHRGVFSGYQSLVDCDKEYHNGYNGGLMSSAFRFIKSNGGITSNEKYGDEQLVVIDGHGNVPVKNEDALLKAVANISSKDEL